MSMVFKNKFEIKIWKNENNFLNCFPDNNYI